MKSIRTGRNFGFDNIRGILIILMVFAHLLEIRTPFAGGDTIYRIIYSFHMPVFLFICGWFAHFDRTKIFSSLLLPYFLLQIFYIYFQRWLYGSQVLMQFTTPYWLLWFLLALFFYHLLIPIYDVATAKARLGILAASVAVALLAGYDNTIGYTLSISRILTFQPFFLLGFYLRRTPCKPIHRGHRILICCPLVICLVLLWLSSVSNEMLYGSYSYQAGLYGIGTRLFLLITATLWVLLFHFILRPLLNRRIPVLSYLGKHTLTIFVLHGFCIKFIAYRYPQILENPLVFLFIAGLILLLTGNPLTVSAFRYVMPDYWIRQLMTPQPPKKQPDAEAPSAQ